MCVYIYKHIGKRKTIQMTVDIQTQENNVTIQITENTAQILRKMILTYFFKYYKNLIYFLSTMVFMYTLILEMV